MLQMPSRQGVLVSAPPVAYGSGVIASLSSHSHGDNTQILTSEGNVQMDKGETEKRALEEMAKKGKGVDAGKIPSSPAGAKLPLSSPPEAGEAERRRGRDEKREEKRGTRASSSSDSSSSDSDSGSSSSRSSGSSSSSQDKAHATASGRRVSGPLTYQGAKTRQDNNIGSCKQILLGFFLLPFLLFSLLWETAK